ncbi:MAG: alkaline phosphatase family protein [Gammaproteobacteria bacterium]
MSMNKIEHVVHLMLENRSFDSLLGWLYQQKSPQHNIPPATSGDEYRGLQSVDLESFTNSVAKFDISSPPIRGAIGASVPDIHPGEEYRHINMQLFGEHTVTTGDKPTMKGYMEDYADMLQKGGYKEEQIKSMADMVMQSFTPEQLPVLNQLAEHYAVCDDWYSSVPSQTNTNRAFGLMGDAHGLVDNGFLETNPIAKSLGNILGMGIGDDRFPDKTLWNALEEGGLDWKVFFQTSMIPQKISKLIEHGNDLSKILPYLGKPGILLQEMLNLFSPYTNYLYEISSGEVESCYSYRLYTQVRENIPDAASHFAKTEEFHTLARTGKLPKYSYIEPFWTISRTTVDQGISRLFTTMGNDYHPPGNLNEAENYVKSIYESLIANKASWDKTLFIITFDEPVGAFDHVKPPAATPPWGDGQPEFELQEGFEFNRFGSRVPAILISPLIEKGTVFRSKTDVPFDHTSVISTVLDWCGMADKTAEFGERTKAAPKFDHAITRDKPRSDASDIGFLNLGRKMGAPVSYGDRFYLKNQSGDILSDFKLAEVAGPVSYIPESIHGIAFDMNLMQNFPTLGQDGKTRLFCQAVGVVDPQEICHNDFLHLISDEQGLGSFNYLGAWYESHDCFYFNVYLRGEHAPKQLWQIQKLEGEGSVKFGDKVYLVNQHFANQRLSKDNRPLQGKWITTKEQGDYWIILPVE